MKTIAKLLTVAVVALGATAFASDEQPTAVILQDQHGNYNTMFVRPAATRTTTTVALYAHGSGVGRDNRGEMRSDYNTQSPATEYRSR